MTYVVIKVTISIPEEDVEAGDAPGELVSYVIFEEWPNATVTYSTETEEVA